MARRKANGVADHDDQAEAAKASEVAEQISQPKFEKLLKAARAAYKEQRSIAGTFGEKIGQAVEHDHLDKSMFAIIQRLDRFEPEKLAAKLECLLYYLDISGLNERAASAPRLDNVTKFPSASEAAE